MAAGETAGEAVVEASGETADGSVKAAGGEDGSANETVESDDEPAGEAAAGVEGAGGAAGGHDVSEKTAEGAAGDGVDVEELLLEHVDVHLPKPTVYSSRSSLHPNSPSHQSAACVIILVCTLQLLKLVNW